MEKFDKADIDTLTMRLIVAIDAARSVSAGAMRVGLSQSTASYRLDKLRAIASDAVFERGKLGMEATILGRQIVASFTAILTELEGLSAATGFDPLTAKRDFNIAAAAPETEVVLAPLVRHLADAAPGCRLIAHSLNTQDLPEKLCERWDIALLTEPPNSGVLKRTQLFTDRFVTFYDPARGERPDTIGRFCAAEHALADLGSDRRSTVDTALRKMNRSRTLKLVVGNIESLAPLMKGTNLITTIPARLAAGLMRDFCFVECPVPLRPVEFHAVWHKRKDGDAGNRWFRGLIRAVSKQL